MKSAQKKLNKSASTKKVVKKAPIKARKSVSSMTKRSLTSKARPTPAFIAAPSLSPIQPKLNQSVLTKAARKFSSASVQELNDPDEALEFITKNSKKVVVVDFYADWCGPCRNLAPKIEQMAVAHPLAAFAKVNADDFASQEIVSSWPAVTALPTVMVFAEGAPVEVVVGYRPDAIVQALEKHGV